MHKRLLEWWPVAVLSVYFLIGLWAGLTNNP